MGAIQYTLAFEMVVRLMAAEYAGAGYTFHDVFQSFYDNLSFIVVYYLGVISTAAFAGHKFRKLVWEYELDIKLSWLRYRSDWLYKVMGRDGIENVPFKDTEAWVDIVSEQDTATPGKAILYRGLAAGYTTKETGALRDIILTDVKRTAGEKNSEGDVKWTRIPGKFFVISYSRVRNMNITYEQHSKKVLQQIESLPSKLVDVPMPSEPG
jgi:hypothetical protein